MHSTPAPHRHKRYHNVGSVTWRTHFYQGTNDDLQQTLNFEALEEPDSTAGLSVAVSSMMRYLAAK